MDNLAEPIVYSAQTEWIGDKSQTSSIRKCVSGETRN